MIRYGIAGIPLTGKGRTFIESVEETYKLELKALEVQLLRVNFQENSGTEYLGMRPRENENSIIIDVMRPDEDGNYQSVGTETVIEEEDVVKELFWNMAKNYDDLKTGGELAKELDVILSIHSPYYMDLLNSGEMEEKSEDHLRWTMIIGKQMEARRIVTHTGFYSRSKKESVKLATNIYSKIAGEMSIENGFPYIGVETSGKPEIFGTAEEVLNLAKKIPGVEPILNMPHYHSLSGGKLLSSNDFSEILERFSKYAKNDTYVEFSGVEYEENSEVKLTAIKHGSLKFETFADCLMDYTGDLTIISCSPLLEHDAQYMDSIYARNFIRYIQRKKAKGESK
ncbi:MAG: endonuclease IV [Candidatus Thermoplasmatota archaeon]|jgi:deoxyribonuclease-4|nr:endonuclease IV [Candidatus Thermoplasmatota archaeon]MCL5988132.1 endonuclease IV [Candidatus Thermoplasmatota archaeon]